MQRDECKQFAAPPDSPDPLTQAAIHSSSCSSQRQSSAVVSPSLTRGHSKRSTAHTADAATAPSDLSSPPSKAAKVSKTHSPNSHTTAAAADSSLDSPAATAAVNLASVPAPPHSAPRMASQAVQPAQPVAAAAAPASAASAASSAGAAGAGAGAGAGASSSSAAAFQPNAAQRHQLNEMRSLQALSSFERSNSAFCSQLYNTHSRMIEAVILQTMNDPNIEFAEKQPNNPAIKIAPMAWRFELFPATNKGGNQFTYSYDTDIPGTTYMMTPQPSFYLPKVTPTLQERHQARAQRERTLTFSSLSLSTLCSCLAVCPRP